MQNDSQNATPSVTPVVTPNDTSDPLSFIGGRKFIISYSLIIMAFALTMASIIKPDVFMDFAKWILGIYVTGNVATGLVSMLK
jgi:hypothetical protein